MKKSKFQQQNGSLSMKDALGEFKNIRVIDNHDGKKDWRDLFWNYPVFWSSVFKKTIPFSYIILSLMGAILLGLFFQSNAFAKFLRSNSNTNDTYTEGMVGAISSFNPLFVSANYVDKVVDSLVFERFVYIGTDGKPTPGVAKEWTISPDNLTYTFVLNQDLYWQNGEKVTIDDVLFTFNTAISLYTDYHFDSVGSALEGITISATDEKTIQFILKTSNPTFFEAISIYIVPKKVLENISMTEMPFDSFAVSPVGSGKYRIEKTEQNAVYLVDNEYDQYSPSLKNIVFRIYPDYASLETAMRVGDIDALGTWDSEALSFMKDYPNYGVLTKKENFRNRILFFNVRKDVLKDKNLRIGLSYLLNKETLLSDAPLEGDVMQGPIPSSSWAFNSSLDYYSYNVEKATALMSNAGYTKNSETGYFESKEGDILSFTLSYLENDLNNRMVSTIVSLFDREGVIIKPKALSYDEISQQVIATRDFEILLYEVETTVDPDQYNLWHSLKVNYPDLNLSGYNYERVDILLEDARKTNNVTTRQAKYVQFQKYLMADAPAIFLYHPTFVFYFDSKLSGIDVSNINFSYERYWNIQDWKWNL